MEPPAKMLRPTLQLQVFTPPPLCSRPPPGAEQKKPSFRIGQGVGTGTKGLESSFNSKDSTWRAVPAHLSLHTPLLSRSQRFVD